MTQSPDNRIILRAEKLTKIFRSGEEEVVVFADLNFEIRRGELVTLVGESGAGKTTLLHLLAGLDTPTRGGVYFLGQRLSEFGAEGRAAYRNQQVGYVWQMHYLLPEFSALENVMLPQLMGGRRFAAARARARELLAEVELAKVVRRRVGELSGGEQQRVALARALANQPAVLLADEPTGNLDQRTAGRVIEVLEGLHRAHGLTSVLATHNLELAQRAQRTLRLSDGTLTETVVPEVH
ncbi:MAG: ABC transporter ATP-binding protein [Acidobacteriia bacterium]|nr:ABC transporter ATP-binding protein [Terriglobia bacterium]